MIQQSSRIIQYFKKLGSRLFHFRKKNLQLILISSLIFIVTTSLISYQSETIQSNLKIIKGNYFDSLFLRIYDESNNDLSDLQLEDPDLYLDSKLKRLLKQKKQYINQEDDDYWVLDTEIKDTKIQIPTYYQNSQSKPITQPFDPRFTLGIYYHYLNQQLKINSNVVVPFNWYDWVDLSDLNKHILAPISQKANCSILDARWDNHVYVKEKEKNRKLEEEWKKQHEEHKENQKRQDRIEVENPNQFCLNELPESYKEHSKYPGFNVFENPGKTTLEKAILAGKSYLYSFAPPPESIVFLTREGSYEVGIDSNKPLLSNNLPEIYYQNSGSKLDVLKEFTRLTKAHKPNTHRVLNDYLLNIPEESFKFKPDEIINQLESKTLSKNELSYLNSLKYSKFKVENGGPPKYFRESRLLDSVLGDHYDWRFFNGLNVGTKEHSLTLHRLIRTWLSFTRKNGIMTWIAHGSLLSWYWNGIAFPWDNDIDVQVPIMDLHKLSLNYNQTLIVEDPEDGFGRYFLDCGTFITLREKGNGNNNIDARFIDIDTGLYIDITALSESDTPTPEEYARTLSEDLKKLDGWYWKKNAFLKIYNCRDNHFSSHSDLSPLIKTLVEGEVGYIPQKYTNVLTKEYKNGLTNKGHSGYIFLPKVRLWLKEEDLYYFLKDRSKWVDYYTPNKDGIMKSISYKLSNEEIQKIQNPEGNPYKKITDMKLKDSEKEQAMNLGYDDLIELFKNDDLLIMKLSTTSFTKFHEDEIIKLLHDKSTYKMMKEHKDFTPLNYEPYLYKLRKHGDSYESKVDRFLQLELAYNEEQEQN
ncbi:unnamed protein product [Candida verbasci]|uniref:LicD/FKTN/FKRP nucleotidyltransferase domain-containing protein n=1 Tax=Candida verbasci TaxID=1227364 RepID=A0A9W4TXB1_9ASCO|nr:unnamed protein product [Candida verbasci]